eukprot:4427649-Prymnesium_polylepis.4
MPSRRLKGTSNWLPSDSVFLVNTKRRTLRNTESMPEVYQSWSTEISVSWKWGEHRTPRRVMLYSWLRWSSTTTHKSPTQLHTTSLPWASVTMSLQGCTFVKSSRV